MTTYTWPSTDAFLLREFELGLRSNVLMSVSPLTGATQTVELPGARFVGAGVLPPATLAQAAEREAFFAKVAGQANRIALWHPARPVPRGTMRGTPTLSAHATAGATSLAIAGAYGANLIKYSKALDNAAWSKGGATISADATTAPDGTLTADKIVEDTSTGEHRAYYYHSGLASSTIYTWSIYLKAAERTKAFVKIATKDNSYGGAMFDLSAVTATPSGARLVSGSAVIEDVGSGWYRCSVAADTSTGAWTAYGSVACYTTSASYTGSSGSGLYAWGGQLEFGSSKSTYTPYATLLAGDFLKVGNQLVQVVDDATADDNAAIAPNIRAAIRTQVNSGASVVWDKPTGLYLLQQSEVRVPYAAARGEPISLEFVEDVSL